MKKYLVTAALPYANGPLHIGHIAGAYLPADIYVRYKRLKGDDVVFICGTDEHGVPITIRAMQEGISPEDVIEKYHRLIKESFDRLGISFDNFSGTHREVHFKVSQEFFLNLVKNGYTVVKEQEQFYCENDKMFLPDRYIEGTCPNCNYDKAKGDQCEKCGKTLDPTDLIAPKCILCGNSPVIKKTKHWFFRLELFEDKLKEYLESKDYWKPNVRDFALSWIKEGLRDRAISRDLNWGIPIPLEEAHGKVMYVWFEAPIGYISSTVEWAHKIGQPDKWKEYWFDKETRLIHFIGKDNIPFHAIIWPATLMAQHGEWILPYDIPANEFMNLEGDKISTSRNWAIWVHEFLEVFPPDTLRYYLCSNLPESKDSNFYWIDFQEKVNEELANSFGNLVTRVLKFVNAKCNGFVPQYDPSEFNSLDLATLKNLEEIVVSIGEYLENFEFRQALRYLREIAFLGNKYFDESKPWSIKDVSSAKFRNKVYISLKLVYNMAFAMYPFMPFSAVKILNMFREPEDVLKNVKWEQIGKLDLEPGKTISEEIENVFNKVEDSVIQEQINKLKSIETSSKGEVIHDIADEFISIEDFARLDLRVGVVKFAERIPKSEKLIRLIVDIGNAEKEIIAGIGKHYTPQDLVSKKIIILNNLKPAKLMGYTSYGMLLAAKDSDNNLRLLTIDGDIEPGSKVS